MMGLADEFTLEMAMAVTGDDDAAQLLQALTQENAFVTRLARWQNLSVSSHDEGLCQKGIFYFR